MKLYAILGLIFLLFGLFLILSPFQALRCHYNNNQCLGLEPFYNWITELDDNVYFFAIYVILSVSITLDGLIVFMMSVTGDL